MGSSVWGALQEYVRLWCVKDCEVGECTREGGCAVLVWGELMSVWMEFVVLSVFVWTVSCQGLIKDHLFSEFTGFFMGFH